MWKGYGSPNKQRAMQQKTFEWTAKDGLHIYGQEWAAESPKALVCIAHGLGEHIGRYAHVAEYLAERNYTVVGYDRRGHGRSGGKRGHSPSLAFLLDEIALLLTEASTAHQELPVFLYGHSQGGGLVLSYALRRHPKLAGIIATSPWIGLTVKPSALLVGLARLMRNLYPGLLQPNGLDVNDLSRDKAVVKAYQADPLVHDRISAAVAVDMLNEGQWLLQQRRELSMPLLLLHGSADGITDPKATQQFAHQLSGDITHREIEGGYHELHNEPEWEGMMGLLLAWMESRLDGGAPKNL